MQENEKHRLAQTKVRPDVWALLNVLAEKVSGSVYGLFQMFADVAVRMMDKNRNLTKDAATCMAVFDNMDGWDEAFNLADPTVQREVGEALYILQDPKGEKHGFRSFLVTKPFFGKRTMTYNVQRIFERIMELLFPSLYKRMRRLAALQVASHYGMSVWCIVHQNPGGEKLVGHLGSFLERKVTDIIQTRKVKDDNTNDVTFEVKQKKARGRDIKDWKFRVLPVNGWGMPEQLDIDLVGKKAKHTAEEVKIWLDANRSAVDWPATLTDIRNKIFKAKCGITNNDELQAYATIATNRRFIIPQPFAEWDEGQKKPKYYINEVEYSNDPPF